MDVNRSSFSKNDDKEKVNNLRNILKALVVRNVSINYCQTFRAIGEFFLKIANFNEEQAFYLFSVLLEKILPYDFYLNGIGMVVEFNFLNELINTYFLKLSQEYIISFFYD